ncbi:MAG: hypothetical protein HGB31_01190 [Erysipelotrichaceae bacterium]|nr:hypothetical protein [Erysipelotrichaceae bacterium]
MIQFKRFFVFIYIHLILTVFLTYLNTWLVVKLAFFSIDGLNVLIAVLWLTLIYMIIGLLWGTISSEKKKLLLPTILYMILLIGLLIYSMIAKEWLVFINGNVPFTYFIRNIGSRDLFVLLGYALGCILPSCGLYLMYNLSFRFNHRKDNKPIIE